MRSSVQPSRAASAFSKIRARVMAAAERFPVAASRSNSRRWAASRRTINFSFRAMQASPGWVGSGELYGPRQISCNEPLVGCKEARLLRLLEQLRDLGLVFRYDTAQGATFTAHPFLREYFR